ncbi:conserved hypothetical protein [Desulforapulum autotrophicum HRM2]|uniref:DUF58 domain-containing protein n=1 Tax=Desulforapulum autotrophicum (strain ATCC 43914 / DSM 3382 / VKM B-1955 / HRM2) TaxID=177437 RepID=C0QK13_DESAH|nr:DUF58 domain-containing protein [Desulforapulum autotrophicum]ACN16039.1 conserved hypothetical protein [Desulforapulum autotrophicum HRM2]
MIPGEIIKKIKRVHIKSRRSVNTAMAGQYRSVFRGSGIEFEEVREYTPGDEIKSIDWKVSARLGRPFIKLYREERESVVMLVIDMSASQGFGTFSGLKLEKAAEVASVLAFSAIKNNDKVGVIFFTDQVEKYIPPKKGTGHVWRLIKEIFTFVPQGRGTDISAALDFLARVSRKRTTTFMISDLLDVNFDKRLRCVVPRHELIAILLCDDGDFELPGQGIVTLSCFETGNMVLLDASNKATRTLYRDRKYARYNIILETLKKNKVDCIELKTDAPVSDTLQRYFRRRERRIR